jgi:hypothetical protein
VDGESHPDAFDACQVNFSGGIEIEADAVVGFVQDCFVEELSADNECNTADKKGDTEET